MSTPLSQLDVGNQAVLAKVSVREISDMSRGAVDAWQRCSDERTRLERDWPSEKADEFFLNVEVTAAMIQGYAQWLIVGRRLPDPDEARRFLIDADAVLDCVSPLETYPQL